MSASTATKERSSGVRTAPKLPRTETSLLGSTVCDAREARFCSIAPGRPAPPAVATARSLARVE